MCMSMSAMRVAISSAAARMLDPGRKAGLIGCLRLKHVAVRDHRHERGDEAVRGGANERALPRPGLRHRSQGASRCRPHHGERHEEDRDAGGEAPQPEAA